MDKEFIHCELTNKVLHGGIRVLTARDSPSREVLF